MNEALEIEKKLQEMKMNEQKVFNSNKSGLSQSYTECENDAYKTGELDVDSIEL